MSKLTKVVLPVLVGNDVQNVEYDLGGDSAPEENGFGYGTCSTAYITTAKEVLLTDFVLKKNGIVSVTFVNAVPSNATLNVNSTGAKSIHHKGAALVNNVIFGGDTATFIYDGTYFNLIAIDRVPMIVNNKLDL